MSVEHKFNAKLWSPRASTSEPQPYSQVTLTQTSLVCVDDGSHGASSLMSCDVIRMSLDDCLTSKVVVVWCKRLSQVTGRRGVVQTLGHLVRRRMLSRVDRPRETRHDRRLASTRLSPVNSRTHTPHPSAARCRRFQ